MPQKTFTHGPEAIAYWREHGGALCYLPACGSQPGCWEAWWDADALTAELDRPHTARSETEAALRVAGLTEAETHTLLADWQ